ncbi:hypothetical protein ACOME3_006484 [Neoechinorhynchus agilis]
MRPKPVSKEEEDSEIKRIQEILKITTEIDLNPKSVDLVVFERMIKKQNQMIDLGCPIDSSGVPLSPSQTNYEAISENEISLNQKSQNASWVQRSVDSNQRSKSDQLDKTVCCLYGRQKLKTREVNLNASLQVQFEAINSDQRITSAPERIDDNNISDSNKTELKSYTNVESDPYSVALGRKLELCERVFKRKRRRFISRCRRPYKREYSSRLDRSNRYTTFETEDVRKPKVRRIDNNDRQNSRYSSSNNRYIRSNRDRPSSLIGSDKSIERRERNNQEVQSFPINSNKQNDESGLLKSELSHDFESDEQKFSNLEEKMTGSRSVEVVSAPQTNRSINGKGDKKRRFDAECEEKRSETETQIIKGRDKSVEFNRKDGEIRMTEEVIAKKLLVPNKNDVKLKEVDCKSIGDRTSYINKSETKTRNEFVDNQLKRSDQFEKKSCQSNADPLKRKISPCIHDCSSETSLEVHLKRSKLDCENTRVCHETPRLKCVQQSELRTSSDIDQKNQTKKGADLVLDDRCRNPRVRKYSLTRDGNDQSNVISNFPINQPRPTLELLVEAQTKSQSKEQAFDFDHGKVRRRSVSQTLSSVEAATNTTAGEGKMIAKILPTGEDLLKFANNIKEEANKMTNSPVRLLKFVESVPFYGLSAAQFHKEQAGLSRRVDGLINDTINFVRRLKLFTDPSSQFFVQENTLIKEIEYLT